MRHSYIPNTQELAKSYRSALDGDYGYIYNMQKGGGIGGFLKKMLNFLIPIGKSALNKGLEIARPELSKLVDKGAAELGKQVVVGIDKGRAKLQSNLKKKKRKRDALS